MRKLAFILSFIGYSNLLWAVEHDAKVSYFSLYDLDHQNLNRARFQLEAKIQDDLSERTSWEVSARTFYDPAITVPDRFSERIKKDEGWEVAPRAAFLEMRALPWRMRIGLQEVVWGEALHFFSADILHPKDYRDLFFNDLNWSRIPQAVIWTGFENEKWNFAAVYFPFSTWINIGCSYTIILKAI